MKTDQFILLVRKWSNDVNMKSVQCFFFSVFLVQCSAHFKLSSITHNKIDENVFCSYWNFVCTTTKKTFTHLKSNSIYVLILFVAFHFLDFLCISVIIIENENTVLVFVVVVVCALAIALKNISTCI